jgi:hypothetical protein
MFQVKERPKATNEPRRLADHIVVKVEREKFTALQIEHSAARAEEDRILTARARGNNDDRSPIRKMAERLLGWRATPEGPAVPDVDELAAVHQQVAVLTEAVGLQRQRVEAVEAAANREICERLEPEYEAHVRRLARAMEEFQEAIEAEAEFRGDCIADGELRVAAVWRVMRPVFSGTPSEPAERVVAWLAECEQYYPEI